MDEKLTLSNGTEITGHLVDAGGTLFLYLFGIGLREAFDLLIEPENVKVIQWEKGGEKGTVRGYKKLFLIADVNGMIDARLNK